MTATPNQGGGPARQDATETTDLLAALTELQLRVARRADELARADLTSSGLKLICWLRAEHEILEAGLLTEALRATSAVKWAPPLVKIFAASARDMVRESTEAAPGRPGDAARSESRAASAPPAETAIGR